MPVRLIGRTLATVAVLWAVCLPPAGCIHYLDVDCHIAPRASDNPAETAIVLIKRRSDHLTGVRVEGVRCPEHLGPAVLGPIMFLEVAAVVPVAVEMVLDALSEYRQEWRLAPGDYSIRVRCGRSPGPAGEKTIKMTLKGGHVYELWCESAVGDGEGACKSRHREVLLADFLTEGHATRTRRLQWWGVSPDDADSRGNE